MITGGDSGMGRVAARVFAERGAFIVVADIDARAAEETSATERMIDGRAEAIGMVRYLLLRATLNTTSEAIAPSARRSASRDLEAVQPTP